MIRRALVAGLMAASTLVPFVATAQSVPYADAIYAAADYYGVSGDWLVTVMECESGGDPDAVNPDTGDAGLFQFRPQTYYDHGGTNLWDPYEQIWVAAQMFSDGQSYQWLCA